MRRFGVRLRIWWLMAAIAAVGLSLAGERRALSEWERQAECLAFWSALATERETEAGSQHSPAEPTGGTDALETWAEKLARTKEQAAWHAREAAS